MTKKNKILIVGKTPPPYYGTSVWFESLRTAAWDDDFEMHFFDNKVNTNVAGLGKFSLAKVFRNFRLIQEYRKLIRTEKPDLVLIPVSQTTMGFLRDSPFIYLAGKRCTTQLILHGSEWLQWQKNLGRTMRNYLHYILKKVDSVIVLGQELRYLFKDHFSADKIHVVPNGLTIQPQNTHKANPVPVLLYLGNLQQSKGIKDLLISLTLIPFRDYELQVIGSWREKETESFCLEICRQQSLPVQFLGPKYGAEKEKYLANADLFVFTPNRPEGLPLSLIEALACALPIVCTRQGAIPDLVKDGWNGFVLEPGNHLQISEKIKLLLDNETMRREFALHSQEHYQAHYTKEKMIAGFSSVFRTVLNQQSKQR